MQFWVHFTLFTKVPLSLFAPAFVGFNIIYKIATELHRGFWEERFDCSLATVKILPLDFMLFTTMLLDLG